MEHAHFIGELIVGDERVSHFYPSGFYGVLLAELIFSNLLIVKIGDFSHKVSNIII